MTIKITLCYTYSNFCFQNAQAYPWTEVRKEASASRDTLNADTALRDFRSWVASAVNLPLHDHAILFTG